MTADFLKRTRVSATIRQISDKLTEYVNSNEVKEEEIKKVLELVCNKERLLELIPYL